MELVQPGGSKRRRFVGLVVRGNFVWYLVIFVMFMGFEGAKRWGNALKSSFGVAMQAIRFKGGGGLPLCNTAVLKLFCRLTGYCKRFYRIPLFPIFQLFYLFGIYCDWQGQECKLKCPKIYKLTLNYIAIVTHSCDTNTFTHNLTRIHLLQLKIHNI